MDFSSMPVYVYVIFAVMIAYGVFYLYYVKKQRAGKRQYIADNPDMATVRVHTGGQRGIKSLSMGVHTIDGSHPTKAFQEGFYFTYPLTPGTHIINVEAQTSRPGVMHKTVTEIFGPEDVEITVEAGCHYRSDFDTKASSFVLKKLES